MLIHLTKTSWTAKAVLVLAAIAFLVPTFFVSAQDGDFSTFPPPAAGDFSTFPPPPTDTIGGDDLLFLQPVLTGDPVTDAEALANARAAGGDALRQAGLDSSYTPGNQKPDVFGDSVLKSILYFIMVSVFGTFLGWAGELLNFGINNFVIGFGTAFNTQGVGEAVNMLWSLVRDFFNILFIFGFIWIGFQMILDSGNSQAKKTLISLIMAALLVNFSLFISKFVVDFSNRLASEVAVAAFPASGNAVGNIADQEVDVATTFFQHMGIAKSLDVEVRIINNDATPWAYIFGSGIFYLVGAFVFAAGGIMLIIRFVALSIFMVLSPFMFLGWVFPGMQGWTDKYWKGFLGRAFYAPVYIILLFFAGTILQNFFGQGRGSMQNPGLDNPLISADSLGTLLAPFILSCAFLIAAVQVSGKMSADGAGGVMKVGGNIVRGGQRRLKNGAIGAGRFGVRNTAGLATTYGVNRAGQAGREALRRRNAQLSQSDSRFDRWRARTSERTTGAALDRVATATVAGSETRADRLARVGREQNDLNTAAQQADRVNRNDRYGRMSNEEVLRLSNEQLRDPVVLAQLTNAHMDAIQSSGRFTNDEFSGDTGIQNLRRDAQVDQVTEPFNQAGSSAEDLSQAFEAASNTLRRMDADTKASLGVDRLTQERLAVHLTDDDLRDMQQTGRLDAGQIQQIRTARDTALGNLASGSTNYGRSGGSDVATAGADTDTFHNNRRRSLMSNPQQAGRLPANVFAEPSMRTFITTAALTQRIRNGNVDEAERVAIEDNLQDYITDPATSPRAVTMWQNWSENTVEGASFELV